MRYLGSKKSTLSQLADYVPRPQSESLAGDLFGGIGVVSAFLKSRGYRVATGDQLLFPTYFQTARLAYSILPTFRTLRREYAWSSSADVRTRLNSCRNAGSTWFSRTYSQERRFFLPENALRIEAAWNQIRAWALAGYLNEREKAFLLASLISSMDDVANTAGTYYAYLKSWTRKARRPFCYRFLQPVAGARDCIVTRGDAVELCKQHDFDFLYLDPPYNRRNYSRYYHLPETIARCEEPNVRGRAGIPSRAPVSSLMYAASTATEALVEILRTSRFRTVAIQYSHDGLASIPEIERALRSHCQTVRVHELTSWGYTATSRARAGTQLLLLGRR